MQPIWKKLLAPTAAGNIEFVGGSITSKVGATSGNSTISLTSGLTGGIASSVSDGDLVIAVFATGSSADRTLAITDGTNNYTLIGSELWSNDTNDTNLRVAYKFVSGDTSTTFGPTGNAQDAGAMAVYVFRGVDASPLDVSATTATGLSSTAADPPSIEPVTAGAFIVCIGATSEEPTFTVPSDLIDFLQVRQTDTYPVALGIGHKDDWTSGAFDAAAFAPSFSDSIPCWAAMSIALRPA